MATSHILGQHEANIAAAALPSRTQTDKDMFLKLLVAQLTHQDPLNPVEDKEFIAQLAQFTQVEEMQNIRHAVEGLTATMAVQQVSNAASLMGHLVLAKGDNITVRTNANGVSEAHDINPRDPMQEGWFPIFFKPQNDIATGIMNIVGTDSQGRPTGQILFSMILEQDAYKADQDYELRWHGRDFAGNAVPPGTYIFNFIAEDSQSRRVMVDTFSTGLAVGVETSSDGNHKLTLHDGRTVNYMDIRQLQLFFPPGGGGDGEPGGSDADALIAAAKAAVDSAVKRAETAVKSARDTAREAMGERAEEATGRVTAAIERLKTLFRRS